MPDRSKWGLFSLRNDSPEYLMRNVMVYKKGEEDKDPVAKFDRKTYLHNESAEAGYQVSRIVTKVRIHCDCHKYPDLHVT